MVESQKDSNETNHIICVGTKMWPHFNIDSEVSVLTKYTYRSSSPTFIGRLLNYRKLITTEM